MKYQVRKPYRYGNKIYMPGEHMPVDSESAKVMQSRGILGAAVVEKPKKATVDMVQKEKPVVETASFKPPERAVKPEPEPKVIYNEQTVAELREMLKERDLPTYGTKAELLERLEGD